MPDLIGKTLGGYRIVEQIGLGGMATVYKAYQPSMDRYVALKILSTHLTQDPAFVKRFRQEARVVAKLEHLHILPVHDHGEEEGYLYLVMRFIEAGTLKDRMAQAPLSLEEARRVVDQVGSALEYAHQLGVVHRDLKPSNVLVDPQGDCYLTDFGISKMVESTLGLTGSSVLGTPHYMAPEQSQSLEVDRRADVYAMGVVIYHMVTGHLPFDAETPLAVVMKHISEPLPLPRNVNPGLPEAVERVILKAMAKAPDDRYQSMRDLVDSFDRAVSAAPTEAYAIPPTPTLVQEAEAEPTTLVPERPAPSAGRPPLWILAVAGLALVALLALVLVGVILSRRPGQVAEGGGPLAVAPPTATSTLTATPIAQATPTLAEPSATPAPTLTPLPVESPAALPTTGPATLLAHWPFDGDLKDASRHGYDLQGVGEKLPFVPGCFGQAVHFQDDAATYLTRGGDDSVFDFGHGDWSIELWVRFDQPPSGSHEQTLIEKCSPEGGCGVDGWGLTVLEGNNLRFVQNPGEHGTTDTPFLFDQSGKWYHLAAVRRGENADLFVDGQRVMSGPAFNLADTDHPLIVGRRADEDQRFSLIGALDEVAVYQGALSDAEVRAHYERAGGCMPPDTAQLRRQARALAEPILDSIGARPPDYQDDFRDPDSGWPRGSTPTGDEWGYQDDAYLIATTNRPQGTCCFGARPVPEPLFSDFVLELDAQFLDGEAGMWALTFRDLAGDEPPVGHYAVGFWPDGGFRVWKNVDGTHIELKQADQSLLAFEDGYEPHHLTVVARGPEIAYYMDGEPLWYARDESLSRGGIQLVLENVEPDTLVRARFDNLKLWNISDSAPLTLEPSAAPPRPGRARQVYKLLGHTGPVEGVAWSPDGTTLASAGGVDDNRVIVWDAGAGELLRTLEGHAFEVDVVEWSPDGATLASGSGDRAVILWDAGSGEVRRILEEHTSLVDDLAFSPDGRVLAAGGVDGRVILWDVETGAWLRELAGHSDEVQGVEWSPDGASLATAGYDQVVNVWDAETGERLRTLEGHEDWVRGLAWSPVGPTLASGSYHDGTVIVWNADTGERLHTLEGLGNRVSLAWSPDGALLATGLGDGRVMIWDAYTFERLLAFGGQRGVVESLAWSPDGTMLASAGYDRTVIVWQIPR